MNNIRIERKIRNQQVAGSIPAGGSIKSITYNSVHRLRGQFDANFDASWLKIASLGALQQVTNF